MFDPMDCLRDGVPLSLVMDLLAADGPNARRIYAEEPADTAWTLMPATGRRASRGRSHRRLAS